MLDPLAVIFIPGAIAAVAGLAAPLLLVPHLIWRRRARRLNAESRCARCRRALPIGELFLYGGFYICDACASSLRGRMRFFLPGALVTAGLFGISAVAALALSVSGGGPGLEWWLTGRLIPLLLPSLGFATATIGVVKLGQRANELKNRESRVIGGGAGDETRLLEP